MTINNMVRTGGLSPGRDKKLGATVLMMKAWEDQAVNNGEDADE